MKYVVIEVKRKVRNNEGEVVEEAIELPIVFARELVHKDVADMMNIASRHSIDNWQRTKTIAAGFVNFDCDGAHCHGKSESLGIPSRGKQDSALINHLGSRGY